jgi:hypothetical protein
MVSNMFHTGGIVSKMFHTVDTFRDTLTLFTAGALIGRPWEPVQGHLLYCGITATDMVLAAWTEIFYFKTARREHGPL